MPRSLRDRCLPDSIAEFRAASRERYVDGIAAAAHGRRTAAIYLWGYAAEMTVKAAYFELIGFKSRQWIAPTDLAGAVNKGIQLQISWPKPGRWHNVRAWSELLIKTRALTPGRGYPSPNFGIEIQLRALRIESLWAETLRYHKNVAYLHEVRRVQEAAEWFLANASHL